MSKKWILPEHNEDEDIVEWVLKSRNIKDKTKFLNPSLDHIHDSTLLFDSESAAKVILQAIKKQKKIFIHGDFDVDGITATSIMWRYLKEHQGADVLPYIPSRFNEGYGLTDNSIQAIIKKGGQLIITVDCGIKDIELIEKYSGKIDFIITDHHTVLRKEDVNEELKDKVRYIKTDEHEYAVAKSAKAVVHPKLSDKYPYKEICGATVSWKVCSTIDHQSGSNADMNEYLDLVALGTVCDVMPLLDENRAIVKFGLERMRKTTNKGLEALLEVAGIDINDVDTYHFGYVIGPRLNAAGRISHALDAVRLLCTDSKEAALSLARKLNKLNFERQELTKKYYDLALEQVEKQKDKKIYFVYGEKWPEGILGLIAGKLNQEFNRPVLVASKNDDVVKGSARSTDSFNIAEALKRQKDLLTKHGGHAGAAGFTLPYSNLEEFINLLQEDGELNLQDEDLVLNVSLDFLSTPNHATLEKIENLMQLAPFGQANREPLVGFINADVLNYDLIGKEKNHVKFAIKTENGIVYALGFNKSEEWSSTLQSDNIDFAGHFSINVWNGKRYPQIILREIRNSI